MDTNRNTLSQEENQKLCAHSKFPPFTYSNSNTYKKKLAKSACTDHAEIHKNHSKKKIKGKKIQIINHLNETSTKDNEFRHQKFNTNAHKNLETRIKLLEDTIDALNRYLNLNTLKHSFNLDNNLGSAQNTFFNLNSNPESTDKTNLENSVNGWTKVEKRRKPKKNSNTTQNPLSSTPRQMNTPEIKQLNIETSNHFDALQSSKRTFEDELNENDNEKESEAYQNRQYKKANRNMTSDVTNQTFDSNNSSTGVTYTNSSFNHNSMNPNDHLPSSTLSNPRLRKQPTIAITFPENEKEKLNSPEIKSLITSKLKAKIKERKLVRNRLYLTPIDEQDTAEIMREDSEFLPGLKRKALNDKYLSIVAFNISKREIDDDKRIQNELVSRGVVCWEALQPLAQDKRSVKLFFNDSEKTILFFRNHYESDLKILGSNNTQVTIRIEPDIASPLQCYKCFALGHAKETCKRPEVCGKCMSTEHSTDHCIQYEEAHLKCVICEGLNGHSSTDRSCPKYRAVKRDLANDAVNKITRSRINSKKKIDKDNAFNDRTNNTYADVTNKSCELESLNARIKAIEEKKDTGQKADGQVMNDVKSLKIKDEETTKEIKKIKSQANADKETLKEGMNGLEKAIRSMTDLGTRFTETMNKLDERIFTIVRQECDVIKRDTSSSFLQQRNEYTSMHNNHENRLALLENLAKTHAAPQQQQFINSNSSNKLLLSQNQQPQILQQTQLGPQQHQQQQPQHHSQLQSVIHEANNFLYRSGSPNVNTQHSYVNSAYENSNFLSASSNLNNKYMNQ